ncbi:TPA: O-antigen ligase family protein [Bacillus anthracis]|uniref:O-antigen ligase family protein n=1 Tax=Bacillus anthracis TaxID=1392 RepID=UPI0001DBF24D|nr:O-antigen ligase family protein [Bacillus cereus]HDR4496041.1 O-antigen ligase family protein [Bacillus cereus biovar anthracis]ADK03613.1 membrane protein, putative [Bacillus cereus biovar anthracis str. CI]HDR6227371.1 O-antigen ligase family protein [Bacillus cereus biovar anthracis]HDR6234563.1 O-antigen ligase family protein [Bacillus cereus biovar anthracis]HDR6237876.1 O-antigen ligase family protein [Bacillus cereus biovar anthracis]
MVTKLKQTANYFPHFLLLFIVFQPILDLLTSFSIYVLHMSATVGIVVRFAFMLLALGYLLLHHKQQGAKKYILYLCLFGIVLAIGLVNNLMIKSPVSFGEEVKFIMKSIYPIVLLFGYIIALKELKNNEFAFHKIITYFLYATLILSISIITAMATGTDFPSYPNSKIGSRGWFFAGNDLSSIFAIMFPIVVLYSVHKTTSFSKVYYWIPTVLAMYASIMIGTKVGYGAIVITLGIALFFLFIEYMMHRKKEGKGFTYLVNTIVAAVVLGGLLVLTPQTPIAKNMSIHLQIYEYKKSVQDEKDRKEGKVVKEEEHKQGELTDSEMKSLIYSDRDKFLKVYKQYYKEAPLSQKLFGMGYAGNYTTKMKLVEMDFHDLFFAFGIVGFLMYLLPLLYFGIKIFIRLITNFKKLFSVKHMLLASTLVLSLGIGFMSGHVLTAPAVSIFFVVILAYLIVDLEIE